MRAKTSLLLAAWTAVILSVACCSAADVDGPHPQWIWADGDRGANQVAFFRKSFFVGNDVQSAMLVATADFSHMTVYCNGQRVAVVEDYEPRIQADVTDAARQGDNLITVAGVGSEGPSAVAVQLELVYQDGTRQSILTDGTWLSSLSRQTGWQQPEFTRKGWQPAIEFGPVSQTRFGDPNSDAAIHAVDDYTQWEQALGTETSADPSTFLIPPGFEIELLRSARPDEGSWTSLAFDPAGRLVIAKEEKGLLRLTLSDNAKQPVRIETINDTLEECRGLLFAYGCLYANANNSKGLYRLRDTNGDDQLDEIKLLYHSPGGVGHGRNDLALGPDGMIYSIHGDAVDLPNGFFDRSSPFREHRRGIESKEGHVIRTDRHGERWELVAAGFRNPFGIDFNADGEMFTYDADAEFDMGAPWYRPTRVHHVLPGGDYGWRGVTKQWPPYYPDHPDAAPPNLNMGKGSPTAVRFGTQSNFPPPYRRALFILDWAYGRILAVHTSPRGASYVCRAETFARGRPMNVTDLAFGPDRAMYFVTGGRKTKSGLYRIRYTEPNIRGDTPTAQQRARSHHAVKQRALRRQLESLHGKQDPESVDTAWPHLDSPDPWLRHAARIVIEHQPIEWWESRAIAESRTTASLTTMMALAGSGRTRGRADILTKLCAMSLEKLTTSQKLIALRIYELCLPRADTLADTVVASIVEQLNLLYPDDSWAVNRELSKLLGQLDSPSFVEKTMKLLEAATDQEQQLHYVFVLRTARNGWTPAFYRSYFRWFRQTEHFTVGAGMEGFIRQIKDDAVVTLRNSGRPDVESILAEQEAAVGDEEPVVITRAFVREWTMEDLIDSLPAASRGRDFERGKVMFTEALCARCHRLGSQGRALGPDLTAIRSRFSRRDLLESIVVPSKVVADMYQNDLIETADGRVLVGSIIMAGDYRSPHLKISTDSLAPGKVVEVAKSEIVSYQKSPVSPMPAGLLNTLNKHEILDLLAYLEAGGEPNRRSLRP